MEAVIFDMDGTLCDVRPIRHYVEGDNRNFDAFHKASLWCGPNWLPRALAYCYRRAGVAIIIVTARDARYERVTRDWLVKYGIEFDAFYMRPWGDQRKDAVVKAEILAAIRADGYQPILAVDDNPNVIALWESESIDTITIPGW